MDPHLVRINQWTQGQERMQQEGAAFWHEFQTRGLDWHRALPQGPMWAQQARKSSSMPDSSLRGPSLSTPDILAGPHSSRLCTQLSVCRGTQQQAA